MSRVSLSNINKIYADGNHVVKDLNLEISNGEFMVLVGPSGCGKSTTLRMVAGLEDVSSGTLRIGDRVVNTVAPKDRDIAMVFQNYALYPHKTVAENMGFALRLRGLSRSRIEESVLRAAELLGIVELLGRKPGTLSGGQRQRVALGRAIVREPKCFLFDEPLSNLDAKLRVQMRAELKRLHFDLGSTTIYVTHDQEEAMTLGDRVAVMKEGVIQQEGRALDIYRRPANRFVAEFLGSPPFNFMRGELRRQADGLFFKTQDLRIPVPAAAAQSLCAQSESEVVAGFRPESLALATGAPKAGVTRLAAKLSLAQPLGDRVTLHASVGSQRLIAQCPFAELDGALGAPGTALSFDLDPRKLHFFAADEGGARLAD